MDWKGREEFEKTERRVWKVVSWRVYGWVCE
jgi:hypothetical protein